MKRIFLLLLLLFMVATPAFSKGKTYPKPLVVTFLKSNCDECDALDMVRQAVEEEYKGQINFVIIDIEEEDADYAKLMARYNINSAPVSLFINSEHGVTKKVADYLPYNIYMKNIKAITE